MTQPVAVINVVALSESLIGDDTPHIRAFRDRNAMTRLRPVLPAVTCSVQSSMLTGLEPSEHGIVGNGWYNREMAEVQFWKQSNRLVRGEKVWETARRRDPSVTCANMFWWYNMYSSADWSVTPRPIYKADGRKIPDVYSNPSDLRDALQEELGRFPLFKFWGPMSSIESSEWIARASMRVHSANRPTLTLVYLPHLDYGLQKLGPDHPDMAAEVRAIDAVAGELIDYFEKAGVRVLLVSEYGIEPVTDSVHVNRVLREAGGVSVREEEGLELLDAGASEAFAVADHQLAHVYVRNPDASSRWAGLLSGVDGIERVLDTAGKRELGIDHERAGDLVLIAERGRWFSYDYWLDDRRAPDFARTVDIHRKPGYDPAELFIDPAIGAPKLRLAMKLARKRLGFRTLMDVIPLDTSLVRGSHGRVDTAAGGGPVLIGESGGGLGEEVPCTAVRDVILRQMFED